MNLIDWIKEELYSNIYEVIDEAFPEHDFKRFSGGWRSKTYLNGTPHKSRIDKTVITKNAHSRILEQGGDTLGVVEYVMRRDNIKFLEAVKNLADIVGLKIPKGDFNEAEYNKQKYKTTLLEACNNYFSYCLETLPEAQEVREYLYFRGYSDKDIKAMQLGYVSSLYKLSDYLESKGLSRNHPIIATMRIEHRIGSTHKLTIPYRSGGYIKGFKYRAIGELRLVYTNSAGLEFTVSNRNDATVKYINSLGLQNNGGFFNLLGIKGDKDVVIVEGELDSLSATVRGIDNVVSCEGNSISSENIKDAIRKGAKSFTICFDRKPEVEEKTNRRIQSAIEVILAESINSVYIATLPDLGGGKTNPDRLIKEKGLEALKKVIKERVIYWEYNLQTP